MDITSEMRDFELLGVDCKPVTDAQAIIEELEKRIKDTTAELLKLRPVGKEYDTKLAELQARTNAYQAQLEGARSDLAQAIEALKRAVINDAGKYQNDDYEAMRKIDEKIISNLLEVREFIFSRAKCTSEFDAKRAILDRYKNELVAGVGLRDSRTPWLQTFPATWPNALKAYVDRFMVKAGSSGDSPGDGDVLEWLARRR